MYNIITQFKNEMVSKGITPPEDILVDGKLHRFSTNGKHKDVSGWYVLHSNGVPAGSFGDFRLGITSTWRANFSIQKCALDTEYNLLKAFQKKREEAKYKEQIQSAKRAQTLW